jgi:hypothetical protein
LRALIIGALGLTLLGCSHSPPPQASASSCPEAGACDDHALVRPAKPAPSKPRVAAAHAANPSPGRVKAGAAANNAPSKLAKTSTGFANARASVAERQPAAGRTASDSPRAEMAAAEEHKATPASGNTDALMAVVMARPDVNSVAELAGKTVAIDDRYSQSSGAVRTAIAAAGATEVQLSEGQATAMSRLGNGEVPAAVVALVTPEAAETFPAIAGYRIFHVPLSPRSVRSGQTR